MKLSSTRRYRRSTSRSRETGVFKKDNQPENMFFAVPSQQSFFKPVINRKCAHCEAEDKQVKRAPAEEEKKIQKVEEKKEELHRLAGPKEEEKTIHKMEDKKEEVHRQAAPEEEDKKLNKMGEKKEEEKTIAKKEANATNTVAANTGNYIRSLSGKGSRLPKETLHFFGERMGYDFGHVKIHTGNDAEKSAKDVNAKAYAVEHNIVFNKGQYNPSSAEGKKLLAHELTHVMQQEGNDPELLNRVAQLTDKKKEDEKPIAIEGKATKTKQKTSYGCGGVQVGGQTDANYKSSFKTKGKTKSSDECTDCSAPDCISSSGTVISTFKSQPVITLPDVPDGLSKCEAKAVRKFINGTLKKHEQQHKKAFQTYDGVIKTPYEFTGCKSELGSLVQSIHDGIDAQRSTDANALSDALDPFNVPIPCNCE